MDYDLTHALNHGLALRDGLADPFETFGSVSQGLFMLALLLLFLPRGPLWARRAGVGAGVAAAVGLLVTQVVSQLVDRPRPFVAHPHGIHALIPHAHDAGFPSDHATAAFAIAGAVWVRSRPAGGLLLALAALILVDRVGLGLHYPLDVVAGAVVGLTAATLVALRPVRHRTDALADAVGSVIDSAWASIRGRVSRGVVRAS